mmetsp:Transcript_14854/g.31197  ORF Transcript_14854/g.31197 Transcript_14854/m.31197 type:complete len:91 (+) Transcript_14854:78-350(+)
MTSITNAGANNSCVKVFPTFTMHERTLLLRATQTCQRPSFPSRLPKIKPHLLETRAELLGSNQYTKPRDLALLRYESTLESNSRQHVSSN